MRRYLRHEPRYNTLDGVPRLTQRARAAAREIYGLARDLGFPDGTTREQAFLPPAAGVIMRHMRVTLAKKETE